MDMIRTPALAPDRLDRMIRAAGFAGWGVLPYDPAMRVLDCRRAAGMPEGMRSVLILTLPYFAGRTPGTISKYARAADYHRVADGMLQSLAATLADATGGGEFYHFCDNSPFDEVTLAIRAGLGVRRRGGLLITPAHGSYVFLATLVTDLDLPTTPDRGEAACTGCGLCAKMCPTGAITPRGLDRDRCLSAVSQRKGDLPGWAAELMRTHRIGWGCDICQDVCPNNRAVAHTPLEPFLRALTPDLTEDVIAQSANRAYGFRGKEVLRRNLKNL